MAVNNIDKEYTSASTAENQKVSENVKANAPIIPAEMIEKVPGLIPCVVQF